MVFSFPILQIIIKTNNHKWLRRYSKFTAISTLFLIFFGGLVTSTDSGLSVPDWPNTYGEFMFTFPFSKWVGGIFYEHLHRLIASFVGFLTLLLSIFIWMYDQRKWIHKLGWIALTAVIVQGLLGGLTVIFYLPTIISMTHGILAQSFFCLTIAIAFFLSKEWTNPSPSDLNLIDKSIVRWILFLTGVIYLQLIFGALMRHTGSGLAVLDFPLSNGQIFTLPNDDILYNVNEGRFNLGLDSVTLNQIFFHLIHRFWALIVVAVSMVLTVKILRFHRKNDYLIIPILLINLLLFTQILLAAFVIWTTRNPIITTLHVWTGALLLGSSFFLSLRSIKLFIPLKSFWCLFEKEPVTVMKIDSPLSHISSFWELSKPRIIWLVLVATFIGFYLGSDWIEKSIFEDPLFLLHTILGTTFVAAGAGVLNQYLERDLDKQMRRTSNRPIPSGRIKPSIARKFGIFISSLGLIYLLAAVSFSAAFIGFTTLFLYLIVYTPLKRQTTWNTFVGAIPGALPPLGGWLAATGDLEIGGWVLFGILFFWQIPHFFAIAWLYRKDYRRLGFQMLPVLEGKMSKVSIFSVSFSFCLIVCTSTLTLIDLAGEFFFWGSIFLGLGFLAITIDAARGWNKTRAKRLLFGSIIYLPLLLFIMIIDKSLI
ncbi:MAG: protoheme IX farnesyltransferase [Candidatus Marinimicrobia bacterium]|nr:protoheme IX farnesyltransferase [Candidatus Neomarinimicrobiota bacterium]